MLFIEKKYELFLKKNGIEKAKYHTHFQRGKPFASVQIRTRKRAREREKRTFFVPFILSERNFCKICFNSMYSVLNKLLSYLDLSLASVYSHMNCKVSIAVRYLLHVNLLLIIRRENYRLFVASSIFTSCKNHSLLAKVIHHLLQYLPVACQVLNLIKR